MHLPFENKECLSLLEDMGRYYLIFKMDLIEFLRLIYTNAYSFPLGDECQETLASLVPCKNGTHASDVLELAYINMAL